MSDIPTPKPDNVAAAADAITRFHDGLPPALQGDPGIMHEFTRNLFANSTIVVHYTVPDGGDR